MASISAASIVRLHTVFATAAFGSALLLGCALHFKKIVKNDVSAYPEEWFPSVSATIGDWYPERNVFQILIAITSGPRFALVFLQYFLHHTSSSSLPTLVFISGLIRTLSCGGWVYITSTDDHNVHDVMMILYMVCNIPWMILGTISTPKSSSVVRGRRTLVATTFFAIIAPMVYFFVQHKVHRIPGAYTRYAFFEWALIFLDVLYDSISEREFKDANLQVTLTQPAYSNGKHESSVVENESKPIEHSSVLAPLTLENHLEKTTMSREDNTVPASVADTKPAPPRFRQSLAFVSDVYLAYVFWTLLTALVPTFFYFSVWELSIAGHEATLLSVLSPLLLSCKSPSYYLFGASKQQSTLFDFVATSKGQTATQLASLIALVAYAIPSPGARLLCVATANVVAVLRQVVAWAGLVNGEDDVSYQALVFGLAVTLGSVIKQANRSNNPIWPFINHKSDGYNNVGIALALLAIYEYSTRNPSPASQKFIFSARKQKNPYLAALPLGSLVFTLHNLLSESSTIVAWSWTGYSNRLPNGPLPHLYGSLTVATMAFGLLLASFYPSGNSKIRPAISSSWWFLFGAQSAYVMYSYRNWIGFAGGLGLALFLLSILPPVFELASRATSPAYQGVSGVVKVYTLAFFVYCLFNVASVFTVAYAFVPGGVYFRERTDLVLIAQMACLLPAFRLPVGNMNGPVLSYPTTQWNLHKYSIRVLIGLLPLLSLLTTLHRIPKVPPQPFKPGPRIVNAGIWTVHFGIDNEGHDSQKGMAQLINDMQLDIVGLLETDLHRTPFANRDLTRYIVEELNYNVDIGPGPNAHTWGAVLLTKFPIISTKHHLLPSPDGELAPAIEAVLDIYGTEVLVLVSHNGQEETPLDRELQSTELAKIMAASERPVIFLGYLVTKPWAPRPSPYGIMVDEGKVFDIDTEDNSRWCEYILYRGLYRTSYARVSQGIITDTELQIGQFVLPKYGHNITDDSHAARYLRSWKEDLPVDHWFPIEYYGDAKEGGVNGHYYHVFNTPLYYKLPEGAVV